MHEFFIAMNDGAVQEINGERCRFSRGRAFFLYSGYPHSIEMLPDRVGEFIFFCFDPEYFLSREMWNMHENIQRLSAGRHFFSGSETDYVNTNLQLADELYEEINSPGMLSGAKITALLTCLIINFGRSLKVRSSDRQDEDNSLLEKLCRKIRKKPEAAYDLKSAAASVAMSRAKFAIKFKEHTGMTFISYITEFRLKKAVKLLSSGDCSVLESALHCGFNNPGLFHRQFKKRFGITPLQMKKKFAMTSFPILLKEI